MKKYRCAILYHNYYSLSGLDDMRQRIGRMKNHDILLLASLPDKFSADSSLTEGEDEKILFTTNMGKDIGGKLLLIDLVLKLYADIPYLVLLHDKRSYQKYSGGFEREKLFRIIEPSNFDRILDKFDSDSTTGIVCHSGSVRNEYVSSTNSFDTTNAAILQSLQTRYELKPKDYSFVAGTMFWVRTSIFADFFGKYSPAAIRSTLEKGNVLDASGGTITHSWERLLSWIASARGYKIQGI